MYIITGKMADVIISEISPPINAAIVTGLSE
jgi:hypothetical protein